MAKCYSKDDMLALRAQGRRNEQIAKKLGCSLNTVYKLIGKQPAEVRKRFKVWVDARKRLPPEARQYLCWLNFEEWPIAMTVRYLGDGAWSMPSSVVTHWMENPEAPEEEEYGAD